jgi:hypothetical protein
MSQIKRSDDGNSSALRYAGWKLILMKQKAATYHVWIESFVPLCVPLIENLCRNPYERETITSSKYL